MYFIAGNIQHTANIRPPKTALQLSQCNHQKIPTKKSKQNWEKRLNDSLQFYRKCEFFYWNA